MKRGGDLVMKEMLSLGNYFSPIHLLELEGVAAVDFISSLIRWFCRFVWA